MSVAPVTVKKPKTYLHWVAETPTTIIASKNHQSQNKLWSFQQFILSKVHAVEDNSRLAKFGKDNFDHTF